MINSKTDENEWLDYKQEWHNNKIELVRDILAFTNTVHHKNCYLIFGIEDKTLRVLGVNEDKNRKNTQQITDLLVHQHFSGDVPKVKVQSIKFGERTVDILTVFNTLNVPLFLTETFEFQGKRIYPGQIVTRIADTNTPSIGTASDIVVEKLYRKRMRLDQTIYERYRYLIEQVDDWTYIDSEQKLLYNFDPNFYILIEALDTEDEKRRIHEGDYYGWLINSSSFPHEWRIGEYNVVSAMYGKHEILTFSFLFNFDRNRGLTIAPKSGNLGRGQQDLDYNYFIKDSLDWKFMSLYIAAWNNHMTEEFHSAYYSTSTIFKNVVFYEDNEELEYVENQYNYNTTIEDLEYDFDTKIEPTLDEITNLKQKNSNFGRLSLLQINIAQAINERLKSIRNIL